MRLDPAGGKKLDGGLSLAESYDLCRRVQKAHSRTYYFSTRLFPAEVRPRVHALYAFMRYADEIVDTPHDLPLDAQLSVLEDFEDAQPGERGFEADGFQIGRGAQWGIFLWGAGTLGYHIRNLLH